MILTGALKILLAVQAVQASLTGTVRDRATGTHIAGAVVSLPDLEREVITDVLGRYTVRNIPPGPQHVSFRVLGYAGRTLHALVPESGVLEISVSLRSEPIALDRLDVQPRITLRGAESRDSSTFADRSISIAAVRNHPLLAEPDVFRALSGGDVTLKPESPSGVHIRGGAADQTGYLLDGIPVFNPYHSSGVFSAWNPDALARLDLFASLPSVVFPASLSGVVAGITRSPSSRFHAQGGMSTMQARATVDGPLGESGAGYLLSWRSGYPGLFAPDSDPSYSQGKSGDWLAKLELPTLGGRLQLLGFQTDDKLDVAAVAERADTAPSALSRNRFEWQSRSLGITWTGALRGATMRLQGWSAYGNANANWSLASGGAALLAGRRDRGVQATLEHHGNNTVSTAGIRLGWSRTSYTIDSDSAGQDWNAASDRPIPTAFVEHNRRVGSAADLGAALAVAWFAGSLYPSPRARLRWRASQPLELSLSYARLQQFAQSLRNPESVAGTIFPVDLYLGAGDHGVPVATSDQISIATELRPRPGLRIGAHAHARELNSLVLVAPRDGEPFTTRSFAAGEGTALGASMDAAFSTARYGLLASYGWQRVRFEYSDSSYQPDHGASHSLEAGVLFFPRATSSIRLGAAGVFGRRTTSLPGALEWEACNLLDRGCEFGGSPHYGTEPIGAATLPAYFRVDLGLRHHWHIEAAGRNATLALFGTITNVFGRRNVLTWALDSASGQQVGIDMLPRAPLLLGLDWRF